MKILNGELSFNSHLVFGYCIFVTWDKIMPKTKEICLDLRKRNVDAQKAGNDQELEWQEGQRVQKDFKDWNWWEICLKTPGDTSEWLGQAIYCSLNEEDQWSAAQEWTAKVADQVHCCRRDTFKPHWSILRTTWRNIVHAESMSFGQMRWN